MVWYFIYGSTLSNFDVFRIITGAIILILGIATKGEGFKVCLGVCSNRFFVFRYGLASDAFRRNGVKVDDYYS